jgi:hypothetical protein
MARRQEAAPPEPLAESALTFHCDRGEHNLPATAAEVGRSADQVLYSCPVDGAELVRIRTHSIEFADGELSIDLGHETLSWHEYISHHEGP